jgi:hypothetical protein
MGLDAECGQGRTSGGGVVDEDAKDGDGRGPKRARQDGGAQVAAGSIDADGSNADGLLDDDDRSGATSATAARTAGPPRPVGGAWLVAKPFPTMRGHSAFLTFATRACRSAVPVVSTQTTAVASEIPACSADDASFVDGASTTVA